MIEVRDTNRFDLPRSLPRASLAIVLTALSALGCSSSDAATPAHETKDASSPGSDATSTNEGGARATVTGPITGGSRGLPFNSMPAGMADQYGYTENEYFVEGTAHSYAPSATLGEDGKWGATPSTAASFKTRVLVRRPAEASKFNGTVVVEWLNVSAGADSDPDFGQMHVELLRSGYAYVGVSAQAVGIEGGPGLLPIQGVTVQALKQSDPERYGSLHHPGDDFSYDIFSRVGALVRKPAAVDVLGGIRPEHVIAAGESQSAFRMVTYVNAVHPLAHVFDGFLIHSRAAGGAALSSGAGSSQPAATHIRGDISEPVFQFETETDLFVLGFYAAREPDTDHLRTWEVAGTSHADRWTLDYGVASGERTNPDASFDIGTSCGTVNSGPQHYVLSKAIAALRDWVASGTPPSAGAPFDIADAGGKIARDAHGNALGGVRTPAVDAPIAALSGQPSAGGGIVCSLFGSTVPFDKATLASLYPTHADYVKAVTASAQSAVDAGHLLPADQTSIVADAQAASIP